MKTTITNRYGLPLVADVQQQPTPAGLALIQHGLSGFKEQPHIQTLARVLSDNGYSVVTFDATNSFGESGGTIEAASLTRHAQDLEDLAEWASRQPWFHSPFLLAGHSLGAASCTLYTLKHPAHVRALAPLSCVLSGREWIAAYQAHQPHVLQAWRASGHLHRESRKSPGQGGDLPWAFVEDLGGYDLLAQASQLHCPVFMAVGEQDITTPVQSQQKLYEALTTQKELHLLSGGHTFETPEALAMLSGAMGQWLRRLT